MTIAAARAGARRASQPCVTCAPTTTSVRPCQHGRRAQDSALQHTGVGWGGQPAALSRTYEYETWRCLCSAQTRRRLASLRESCLARSVCMRRVLTWPSIYTDAYETFEDEAKALAPGRVRTGLRKVLQNTDIKVGKYAGSSRAHCTALRMTKPMRDFWSALPERVACSKEGARRWPPLPTPTHAFATHSACLLAFLCLCMCVLPVLTLAACATLLGRLASCRKFWE